MLGEMFWFCVVITGSAIKGYCLIEVFALYLLEHSLLLVEDPCPFRLWYPEFIRLDVQIVTTVQVRFRIIKSFHPVISTYIINGLHYSIAVAFKICL